MNNRNVLIALSVSIALTLALVVGFAYKGNERVAALEAAGYVSGANMAAALTALHQTVTNERGVAIAALQARLDEADGKLKAVDTATTAVAAAALEAGERAMVAQRALFGKERGVASALTTLAERVNAQDARLAAAGVPAPEKGRTEAEAAAKARAELRPWERMLAATRGQSAEQFKATTPAPAAGGQPLVTIKVNGSVASVTTEPTPAR